MRPSGTKISHSSTIKTKASSSPKVTLNAASYGLLAASCDQMTMSLPTLIHSPILLTARRLTGRASRATRVSSGSSIWRADTGWRQVKQPMPRPRKHTTRMVFWR